MMIRAYLSMAYAFSLSFLGSYSVLACRLCTVKYIVQRLAKILRLKVSELLLLATSRLERDTSKRSLAHMIYTP